ncbi:MAG TPA: SURF1 family protein [Methyloceanibacter sp.]|jgi:surfeit locus 1 family protein|nr:SURF1 family protein [Methyloceanibacter sp.]
MQQKSLLGLTMFMLAALAVLLGLGFWQLSRMQWKQGIIAQIETRTTSAPISLEAAEALVREGRDPSYFRVSVEGRFHHAKEQYLYAVSAGRVGWHVITPLETADGEMVLVDRGFVPVELREPAARPDGQIESVTIVTGIVRAPDTQALFTPDNEPATNRWFWRDLYAMSRAMFQQRLIDVSPFFLEADNALVPGGWPEGGQTRLDIPNNHLQYAITWFLLAAGLLVVYAVYVRSLYRGRKSLE